MSAWFELSEMTSVEFAKERENVRLALVHVGA